MARVYYGEQCQPKYETWSAGGTQKTLFQSWPKQLEPAGNPAYEGYGYPAAGYGQDRRKVVPLAKPKVASPQLASNGWEEKQPQMNLITIATLNPNSSAYQRAEVGALAGLGCTCTVTDTRMAKGLRGLSQARVSSVQSLADAIMKGVVPDAFIQKLHDKLVADDKANAAAYNDIQKLKLLDPQNPQLPGLIQQQEQSWGQTNVAKFYALLIPEMQERLGFTAGKPHVTPPNYAYIKAGKDPGVFTKVAEFLREKIVGNAAQELIQQGYMKDSLARLGVAPIVIGGVAAGITAAGILAYMMSTTADVVKTAARSSIVNACASGKLSASACTAALAADTAASAAPGTDWGTIVKFGAIGLGALVVLQLVNSIRSALPTTASENPHAPL